MNYICIYIPLKFSLYYANVSLGTPALSYLVALDTGSDLFWLPCDCGSFCINGLNFSSGKVCYLMQYTFYVVVTYKFVSLSLLGGSYIRRVTFKF